MRVVLLANAASVHTQRWASALASRGFDVHVVSIREFTIPEVQVHRVGVGRPDRKTPLRALLSYGRLLLRSKRLIAEIDPDVINAHYSITHGAIAVIRRLHPVVLTVWGSDVVRGNRVVRGPKRWLNRFVLRRVDGITASSEFLAQGVRSIVGESVLIHDVPFGVDTTVFHPGRTGSGDFTIGFIKHLEALYDPGTLIEAFAAIAPAFPMPVWSWQGAVHSKAGYRRISALGLNDRVDLLGAVPHSVVPDLMRTFDVLVNPSRSESFGAVIIEASATGIPVIVARVGGVLETVVDGETGLLVEPGDVAALTAALLRIAEDPDKRRALGAPGRSFVLSRFEFTQCVDSMVDVLREWPVTARRSRFRLVSLALGVVGAGIAVALVVNDDAARDALKGIAFPVVALILLLQFVNVAADSVRYRMVLPERYRAMTGRWSWHRIFAVGRLLNALIPQAGTAYRVANLRIAQGMPVSTFFGSVAVMTWLGNAMVMVFAGIGVLVAGSLFGALILGAGVSLIGLIIVGPSLLGCPGRTGKGRAFPHRIDPGEVRREFRGIGTSSETVARGRGHVTRHSGEWSRGICRRV